MGKSTTENFSRSGATAQRKNRCVAAPLREN
jgi:hypothetical protein